jgi:hypothetical protein
LQANLNHNRRRKQQQCAGALVRLLHGHLLLEGEVVLLQWKSWRR